MKSMKKTILGIAILAIVLITMMGSVNAASIKANNTEVKKGDTVVVNVNMASPVMAVEFEVSYDASKFEYVSASAGALGAPSATATNGVVTLAIAASDGKSTTQSVSLTFKAKETTEGETFTVSGLATDVASETLTSSTATVKVVEETPVEPETPTNPIQPETPVEPETPATNEGDKGTTTTDSQKAEEKVGTNGKVIKKLPQTGAPVFVGAIALIIVAGTVLVVRKVK